MKYVVLDRDGTLIRHIPYLSRPEQVEVLPTVVEGLAKLVDSGCKLFLHTNQSGIGRGYFTSADALACNDEMLKQIGLGEKLFDGVCVSPEAPDQEMQTRKPSPRYGQEIMAKYAISKSDICYVGDNVTDLLAAKNIGCAGIGVNTGLHDLNAMLQERQLTGQFPVFDRFLDVVNYIVGYNRRPNEAN